MKTSSFVSVTTNIGTKKLLLPFALILLLALPAKAQTKQADQISSECRLAFLFGMQGLPDANGLTVFYPTEERARSIYLIVATQYAKELGATELELSNGNWVHRVAEKLKELNEHDAIGVKYLYGGGGDREFRKLTAFVAGSYARYGKDGQIRLHAYTNACIVAAAAPLLGDYNVELRITKGYPGLAEVNISFAAEHESISFAEFMTNSIEAIKISSKPPATETKKGTE